MLTTKIPNLGTKRAKYNHYNKKTRFYLKEMKDCKHRSNNYWLLKNMLLPNLQLPQQVLFNNNSEIQLLTRCIQKRIAISTNHLK